MDVEASDLWESADLLGVDVRNTRTTIGVFRGDSLVCSWWGATNETDTADVLAAKLLGSLKLQGRSFAGLRRSIVSSSVPKLAAAWMGLASEYLGHTMLRVEPTLRTGMPIRVEHPHELGPARLVNAVAGYARAGRGCVVVDFGTATAFDVVSDDGVFVGTVFAPGIETSLQALTTRVSTVPRISLDGDLHLLGGGVAESVRTGTLYAAVGLCDGMIERIRAASSEDPMILATGQLAALVAKHATSIDMVIEELTLYGLRVIYDCNASV